MLRIDGVAKRYPNGHEALRGIDLAVAPSEIVAVVGGSGCGKSTLLRLIGGLERPTAGRVALDGAMVTGPVPAIGFVFQEPRLMPWLTVAQNVTFGLDGATNGRRAGRHAGKHEAARQILARVGLSDFAAALPRQLSGGMAQRVAIARALVTKPSILLLDEPFSALDALTRVDLQDHLLEVWSYDRPTMILVTHDIDEALVLADRVVLLSGRPGTICDEYRVDRPRPRDRGAAPFIALRQAILRDLKAGMPAHAPQAALGA